MNGNEQVKEASLAEQDAWCMSDFLNNKNSVLDQDLQKLSSWFVYNHSVVNGKQTQSKTLGNSAKEPLLHIGDAHIKVNHILGVHIDSKLSFTSLNHFPFHITKKYGFLFSQI